MEFLGLGAFLSAIVEVLKKFGVIPDGYAGLVAAIISIIVYAAGAMFGVFPVEWAPLLDGILAMLAQVVLAIAAAWATHKVGRSMRVW